MSFILLKSFNLVLPYILDDVGYNEFNKVFYYASLISTIGTFGFTYAITQINFTPVILSVLVVINILVGFFLVNLFSGIDVSLFNILNIFLISFSSILFNVYNFQLLFHSKTNKYFLTIIIISAAYFLALGFSFLLHVNILFLYGLFGFLAVGFCLKYFDTGDVKNISRVKDFYKIGASTFIINSAAGMVLMADKFIANNLFNVKLANAYTFSWAIIAPIFYLGNVAEKNIYAASGKKSLKSAIINSLGLITIGLFFYLIGILLLTNLFSNLLPSSIDIELFNKIVLTMFGGYVAYIFLHFPLNGILFKFNLHRTQRVTSIAHIIIFAGFISAYYFNLIKIDPNNYLSLFLIVLSVLIALSLSKIITIFVLQKKEVFNFFK
ncbi:MAG: hypothetical protein H6609_17400 [Ignavibacteriales bacterium]|nr:hypothetical protein [Ignavibacteriales bacterium]